MFAALNDQAVLQACIPGCESLEKLSDTEMTAKVRLRIGPVSASFSGKVTLSDIDPPSGYKISGEGQGGVAGFAKGGAVVKLADEGGTTVLTYDVDAQVGGKIAQVGARLIDHPADRFAGERRELEVSVDVLRRLQFELGQRLLGAPEGALREVELMLPRDHPTGTLFDHPTAQTRVAVEDAVEDQRAEEQRR